MKNVLFHYNQELSGTNLKGVDLREVNLFQANLSGVSLSRASFSRVNLSEVVNIYLEQLRKVKTLYDCINLYDSQSIPLNQTHPHLFKPPKD